MNGDGFADVIVGAYGYDNGETDEGRAFVYLRLAHGLWAAAPPGPRRANQTTADFGFSVAGAGDVNGDGYADVIVGAQFYDNGQTNEGRAFVFQGSALGLATIGRVDRGEQPDQRELRHRRWRRAGDVNGDGYGDVIVGAHLYDNGQSDEGRAFVFLGSASGLATAFAWTSEANQTNANFGSSVATAGDVNGDGFADVIVGAFSYDNGQTDEGRAFVFLGSARGTGHDGDMDRREQSGERRVRVLGRDRGGRQRRRLLGRDRRRALFDNGQTDEGRAFVFLGSATGPATTAAWTAESDQATADFGAAVASAGDVNGDGYSDVIVGAFLYDNGEADEGRAYVYHGSASGLLATAAWTAEGNQAGAGFGASVATAGDVNGDGFADVIVGAPTYDGGEADEGGAFVYHGSAGGLATASGWTATGDQVGANYGVVRRGRGRCERRRVRGRGRGSEPLRQWGP